MTNAELPPKATALNVAQVLVQAIAQHQAGQLQEAEGLYRAILQMQPKHPEANHNMGVLAVQMKRPATGLPHFMAALEVDPTRGQYWLSYIDGLFQSDQLEAAREVLKLARQNGLQGEDIDAMELRMAGGGQIATQAVAEPRPVMHSAQPVSFPTAQSAGTPSSQEINTLVALFGQGHLTEAATLARKMTERFPMQGVGWKALGVALQQLGKNAEALAPMQKAAELSPDDPEAHYNLGSCFQSLEKLPEAEVSYRRAIQIQPNYAMAHSNLGNVLQGLGRLDEAEASYRKAIHIQPNYAKAHSNLGNILQSLGRLDEAESSYRETLLISPDFAEAHGNLGVPLQKLGRLEESEASFRRAIEINPDFAEAHGNLGVTLLKMGRLDEAEASYRKAIQLNPEFAEAYSNLGGLLQNKGCLDEAEASYRKAAHISPDFAEAHSNLGSVLQHTGRLAEAEASYRRALEINPDYAGALSNLGGLLQDMGRMAEAEDCSRRAIQINPELAEAHSNLSVTFLEQGQLVKAEQSLRRALEIEPRFAKAYSNLGNVLQDMGRTGEAEVSYRKALEIQPDYVKAYSNLLFQHILDADKTPANYLKEARQYGRIVAQKVAARFAGWSCARQPERLRVGLVSGDFINHPIGYFLESVLTHLGSTSIELIAYSTNHKTDELTERLRPHFAAWRPMFGQSDAEAARLIHSDGIHVLIDLSGHTRHNRLPVFAWKPAPVQASWQGYLASTGVSEIDYFLGDPHVAPASEAHHFTEQIWQLPESYMCFTEPKVAVEVAALPALTTGSITFGCLNNLTKMSDASVALWARILKSVPGSKLLLKTKLLNETGIRESVLQRYAAQGVTADRLILEGAGALSRSEYLATYHRIDIALDPFPYAGCTTSIEGLWMGVPIITKCGDRFLSHVGESILHNAGLSDWIAEDEDDYVAKAVAFAAAPDRLANLRAGLRQQVLASPLFDAARFARNFENAMWGMWDHYLKQART